MDDFISVLSRGAARASQGPVLITAGLAVGLIGALGLIQYSSWGADASSGTAGTAALLLVTAVTVVLPQLLLPFFLGGALGYAVEAADGGKPGWPTFVASGKRHYVSLFLAGIVAWLIFYLLALLLSLLIAVGTLALALLPLLALLGLAVMFIVLMFIEFYDIAIVADGADFLRAFPASAGFVSRHLRPVLPFFIIVIAAKVIVQLPLFSALFVRTVAELAANYSLYNSTLANGTFNETFANSTLMATQAAPFSPVALLAIALIQALAQAIAFAFLISYKAEFYHWARGIKKITDFDYDFSAESK